ncbi:hypothetical protein [Phycicoccus sp.]|uniref:hypothetical protein n=1 Tax=Phycicoccus sp. TaxID=1902410 RepID=UPI002C7D2218|nr:hypothetical protein [Phycicoccus sp.]HMM95337.1 hypothetical protein [Phycicoccus sp.]
MADRIALRSGTRECTGIAPWRPRWRARIAVFEVGVPEPLHEYLARPRWTQRGAEHDLPQLRQLAVRHVKLAHPSAMIWGDEQWFNDARDSLLAELERNQKGCTDG